MSPDILLVYVAVARVLAVVSGNIVAFVSIIIGVLVDWVPLGLRQLIYGGTLLRIRGFLKGTSMRNVNISITS